MSCLVKEDLKKRVLKRSDISHRWQHSLRGWIATTPTGFYTPTVDALALKGDLPRRPRPENTIFGWGWAVEKEDWLHKIVWLC